MLGGGRFAGGTHKHRYMGVCDGPAEGGWLISIASGRVCTKAKREDEMQRRDVVWSGLNCFGSGGLSYLRRKHGPRASGTNFRERERERAMWHPPNRSRRALILLIISESRYLEGDPASVQG